MDCSRVIWITTFHDLRDGSFRRSDLVSMQVPKAKLELRPAPRTSRRDLRTARLGLGRIWPILAISRSVGHLPCLQKGNPAWYL